MKVLMIGGGNMGRPFAEGMARSPLFTKEKLQIFDRNADKLEAIRKRGLLDPQAHLEDCLPEADIVFLAVKPYQIESLFEKMRPLINENQVFVSMMAGVKIETIIEGLGVKKVIRTMPNLPAKIGKGVTAHTKSAHVTRLELTMVRSLIEMTGGAIYVDNERLIDASTSISGTGPAYVYYFMQAILEAAMDMGFSEEDSRILVSKTFEGAVELFNNSDISLETWIDRVASKGGTTEAALEFLEGHQIKTKIKDAAQVAFKRAIELGEH